MDQYLIYLRKSRADREAEAKGEGDTLTRHRTALLDLAKRMGLIIADIYEEVVSGESVAKRPQMQKLLRKVESGRYRGVLVMEVERLARGNTRDQGLVAETFQYSGTKIVTPFKTYDPENESDQEYFEFGLFMSRREYKTINRRLQRGREASLREGKYIAGAAPYGYVRVKLPRQKGYTLEIVPEEAEAVRLIFRLYVHGERQSDGSAQQYGTSSIARKLDAEGILSPAGGRWQSCTVRDMILNPTYAGMLRWSYRPTVRRMVDGERVTVRPVNREMEAKPGLHSPIVSREDWEEAQKIMSGRAHPPLPGDRQVQNPLAGLVFCAFCGRSMERRRYRHGRDMLLCPNPGCPAVSSALEDVEKGILDALRCWLAEYRIETISSPPSGKGSDSVSRLERSVSRLSSSRCVLQAQRNQLHDLLEQGVYTPEVFKERSSVLAAKIAGAERALEEARLQLQAEQTLCSASIASLPEFKGILELYLRLQTPKEKNDLLKRVLCRAEYAKTTGGRWEKSNLYLAVFPKIRPF